MTKSEIRDAAKMIVHQMLSDRCNPDDDDVRSVEAENDKKLVVCEIERILQQLHRHV